MGIKINGSTSGSIEIDVPAAIGSDVTGVLLPSAAGTLDRLERTGNILQVVQGTLTTSTVTSSTSTYADLGLSASITPASSSNKIIVSVNLAAVGKSNANSQNNIGVKLLRGSTDILVMDPNGGYNNVAQPNYFGTIAAFYLDSPSTTSSTTYKVQFASNNNTAAVFVNTNGGTSTITLMEVAA